MAKHKKDKRARSVSKPVGPKQPSNPEVVGVRQAGKGDSKAFQQHDAAQRSGSFAGRGNHPRTGNPGHQ